MFRVYANYSNKRHEAGIHGITALNYNAVNLCYTEMKTLSKHRTYLRFRGMNNVSKRSYS